MQKSGAKKGKGLPNAGSATPKGFD